MPRLPVRLALAALAGLLAAGPARTQPPGVPAAAPGTPRLSQGAVASMWTVRPGTAVYSRFGHTAIRIRDDSLGLDRLYNYGTFRFDRWFVPRFAYGAMDYTLSVAPAGVALEGYALYEDRGVVEQTLALGPARVERLFDTLEVNLRPENATYRYDFLFDNCATRPRDVLARVLGDTLVWPTARPSGATFRELIRLYARDAPGLAFAMDLGIGTPVDRAATFRDATFLPDTLLAYLDRARLRTGDGAPVPLVARTEGLVDRAPRPAPERPDTPLGLALALLAGLVGVTVRERTTGRRIAGVDRAVFAAAGAAGVVLAFLAFVSVHRVTAPNATLLWASPLALGLVGMRPRRWRRALALVVAAMAVGGALAGVVGMQDIPVASIPLALAVALRAGARAAAEGGEGAGRSSGVEEAGRERAGREGAASPESATPRPGESS